MRNKYLWIVLSIAVATVAVVVAVFAGNPDSPPGPPESTYSYTLEDIYRRLDTGAAGTPITFTEPISGPGTGTMHTLGEIMGVAPEVDETNGATQAQVLAGATAWGLTGGEWGLITGTYPLAPVPKTGQTISNTVGDDGDLEKGIVWPSPRFITSTTGIVTDTLTGLVWLQDADCLGTQTWAQALTQIGNLNSGTDFSCDNYAAGTFGDWRLPNVRELQSLIDYSQYSPALPSGHPFTGVQSFRYWSSTTYTSYTSYAWYVYLNYGFANGDDKALTFYVWPVRGGQ